MMRHEQPFPVLDTPRPAHVAGNAAGPPTADSPAARLRRMVDGHYDRVWRTIRFLGVPDANAEDAAQQVFCIAARKLAEIAPGAERSFVLATAWRVASEARRAARRRPTTSETNVEDVEASLPSPEELLDQKRARLALQSVLDAMPPDLRVVFVLFELEELTVPEIATAIGVPIGTANSRLRRARDAFQNTVKRRNATTRINAKEGSP